MNLSEVTRKLPIGYVPCFPPFGGHHPRRGQVHLQATVWCAHYKGRLESTDEELQELDVYRPWDRQAAFWLDCREKVPLQVPFLDAPRQMLNAEENDKEYHKGWLLHAGGVDDGARTVFRIGAGGD